MESIPLTHKPRNKPFEPSWADIGNLFLDNIKKNVSTEIALLSSELDKTTLQLLKRATVYLLIAMIAASGILMLITGCVLKIAETYNFPLWITIIGTGAVLTLVGTFILLFRYHSLKRGAALRLSQRTHSYH